MAVGAGNRDAHFRGRVRVSGGRRGDAAGGPIVLVLAGFERFVSRLSHGSVRRAVVRAFPDCELHTDVPERVDGRPCVVVGSTSPPAGIFERLTLVAHAVRRAGAERITALLPYLAYARQDRAARTESLGLEWAGELLRASGIGEVARVDVHSEKAAEVLRLELTSLSPADLLARALPEVWRLEATFVAPDDGAINRASAIARAVGVDRPVVWARKRRTATGVEHLGLVGDPGRIAVVVDDILDTGDTLMSCCRALRESGVREAGLIVTHGLSTGSRWRALLSEGVRQMWITDTVLSRQPTGPGTGRAGRAAACAGAGGKR